jgi:hypothetical protein
MKVERLGSEDIEVRLSLSSEEYDTVYFALRKYADVIAADIVAQALHTGVRHNPDQDTEEFMFLGEILHKTATLAVELEVHNQQHNDTRW